MATSTPRHALPSLTAVENEIKIVAAKEFKGGGLGANLLLGFDTHIASANSGNNETAINEFKYS